MGMKDEAKKTKRMLNLPTMNHSLMQPATVKPLSTQKLGNLQNEASKISKRKASNAALKLI